MALEQFANYAVTTVSSGGTTAPAAGTSQTWTVASSAPFPPALSSATPPTLFHVADVALPGETILVTNVSGTTWTVTRGVEGTTPVAHTAGFTVQQVFSAGGAGMWPQWHNVRSVTYGAQGNGTTNDTTAIQAALTAAGNAGGGVVYLPAGTYLTGALTIPSNVTLLGSGPGCTILSAATGTTGSVLALAVASTTRWTQIRDLTVNCNSISGLTGITLDNTGLSPSTPGFHRLFNVQVFDAGQDGFSFPAQIEMMAAFCVAFNTGRYGFNMATACTDSRFTSCTAGATGSHGFSVTSSNCHYASCKSYYAGYNGSAFTAGHGWYVVGTSAYPVQGNTWSGCEAQDCANSGWYFHPNGGSLTANSVTGCSIDSCNAAGGTGAAGAGIFTDSLSHCSITGNSIWNRSGGAGTMPWGIAVTGTQAGTAISGNSVSVTNTGIFYVSGSGYVLTEPYQYDVSALTGVKFPPNTFPVEWVNVKSPPYSATGNGTTDDTTAIASAITAAKSAGCAVYFPAGTYLVSSPLLAGGGSPGAIQLIGDGWNSEIKLANAADCYIFDFGSSGSPQYTPGLVMRDLYLNCNGTNQTGSSGAVYARGAVWCLFDHLWIDTPLESGIHFYQDGVGNYGHHNVMRACLFTGGSVSGQYGVWLDHCDENVITECTFQNVGSTSDSYPGAVYDRSGLQAILGNNFVGGTGVNVGGAGNRTRIIGNIFDGSSSGSGQVYAGNSGVVVADNYLYNILAGKDGVFVDNTDSAVVRDNSCTTLTNAAVQSGVHLSATCTNCIIEGNVMTTQGTGSYTASGGIKIDSLTSGNTGTVVRDNRPYNPLGALATQPTVPASATPYSNANNADCTVYITAGSSTCAVAIGGTAMFTIASGGTGTARVLAGQGITLTYSNAPTWKWAGD